MRALADRVRVVLALLGPLGAGSRALLLRLIGRFGWKTVVIGALVCVFAVVRYRTWTAWIIAVWCAAAWMHAPTDTISEEGVDDGEDAAEEEAGEDPHNGMLTLLYTLIGDAHGVHLRTVLTHLQKHGQWQDKTVADLRQHLEALDIPVQPKVKVGGTPTRGVLKADLDALPPMEAPPPPTAPSPTV